MNKSDTLAKLGAALAKAQAKIHGVKKGSENPFFKSSYADLAQCIEAIREPFAAHGLSIIQCPSRDEHGKLSLSTMLLHESGEFLEATFPMDIDKPGPQAVGSWITYMRRYSLAAVASLAQVDDDGEGAENREPKQTKKPRKGKKITEAQAAELSTMMADSEASEEDVYGYMQKEYGVRDFKYLTKAGYDDFKNKFNQRLSRQQQMTGDPVGY